MQKQKLKEWKEMVNTQKSRKVQCEKKILSATNFQLWTSGLPGIWFLVFSDNCTLSSLSLVCLLMMVGNKDERRGEDSLVEKRQGWWEERSSYLPNQFQPGERAPMLNHSLQSYHFMQLMLMAGRSLMSILSLTPLNLPHCFSCSSCLKRKNYTKLLQCFEGF